jgi:hypothetical protein
MHIQEVMSADMIAVESEVTLREAARRMSERNSGAALVGNPGVGSRPGIITERDILNSIAAGKDPDTERVADNSTADAALRSKHANGVGSPWRPAGRGWLCDSCLLSRNGYGSIVPPSRLGNPRDR